MDSLAAPSAASEDFREINPGGMGAEGRNISRRHGGCAENYLPEAPPTYAVHGPTLWYRELTTSLQSMSIHSLFGHNVIIQVSLT